MSSKFCVAIFVCVSLCVAPNAASAQYGGGKIVPNGEIAGILIGAGAAIAVVVYLVIPKQKTIEGCVEPADNGLRLTDNNKRTYALVTGNISLQPGERVTIKGRKSKDKSGASQFEVRKLVKDQGACKPSALLIP